jgi:hypothetical protein
MTQQTRKDICLAAAKLVFGEHRLDIESIARRYLEGSISTYEINYQEELTLDEVRQKAEQAAHFVQDHELHIKPSNPTIGDVQERISTFLKLGK